MEYWGWFGRHARKRCPHQVLRSIWGDDVGKAGGWRLQCLDCNRYLDGPWQLAKKRMETDRLPDEYMMGEFDE